MIERLELDQKLANLAKIEKEIIGKQDWDEIIRNVMIGITNTLGYEYVNISLVKRELNCIKNLSLNLALSPTDNSARKVKH